VSYVQKEGDGTLFPNKSRNAPESAPAFKGMLILPDGSVVGIAAWIKTIQRGDSKGDQLISLKIDDREGEFQAKKNDRPQTRLTPDPNFNSKAHAQTRADDDEEPSSGLLSRVRAQSSSDDDEEGGGLLSRLRSGKPLEEFHADGRRIDPDFDDSIPF
jgi:hypothetical protein